MSTEPSDFALFYKFANGFESADDLFRIIPLGEIVGRRAQFTDNHFHVAEYLIYCDLWEIEINPDDPNDYSIFIFDSDSDKLKLTKSFAEFLEKFLAGGVFNDGGLYEWNKEKSKLTELEFSRKQFR